MATKSGIGRTIDFLAGTAGLAFLAATIFAMVMKAAFPSLIESITIPSPGNWVFAGILLTCLFLSWFAFRQLGNYGWTIFAFLPPALVFLWIAIFSPGAWLAALVWMLVGHLWFVFTVWLFEKFPYRVSVTTLILLFPLSALTLYPVIPPFLAWLAAAGYLLVDIVFIAHGH